MKAVLSQFLNVSGNNVLDGITAGFQNIINSSAAGLYAVIILLVFAFIGYLVALVVRTLFEKLFEKLKIEEFLDKNEFTRILAKWHFDQALILLIEIAIILAFVQQATFYINAPILTGYIGSIIDYIPKLIIGIILLVGSLIIAEYLKIIISKSESLFGDVASLIIQLTVVYIGIIYSLEYIIPGFDKNILVMILQYALITLTIAFGLGFAIALGLGLKDTINQAARKNQGLFDNLFAKIGGSINEAVKKKKRTSKKKKEENEEE
jgi:hypothetical protein